MSETNPVLQGKVAVVTGASRGIGRAIAKNLASLGAHVIAAARNHAQLRELSGESGGLIEAARLDVSQASSWEELAEAVRSKQGMGDVLVHNAGIAGFGKRVHETTEGCFDRVMATKHKGVFL